VAFISQVDYTLTSDRYELRASHIAALDSLGSWLTRKLDSPNADLTSWLQGIRSRLEELTATAPEPPSDYRRADTVTCRCRDCAVLKSFLANPDKSVARFPMAKHRRQHLHQIITSHKCDTTHVTERRGSPHTLVCTKTTTSYDEARAVYDQDCDHLQSINRLLKRMA